MPMMGRRWHDHRRRRHLHLLLHNEVAEEIITNLRINLVHAPLSDLFPGGCRKTERQRRQGFLVTFPAAQTFENEV